MTYYIFHWWLKCYEHFAGNYLIRQEHYIRSSFISCHYGSMGWFYAVLCSLAVTEEVHSTVKSVTSPRSVVYRYIFNLLKDLIF